MDKEIMDKIDEFVKNKVHVYYSSDAKDIVIFGYHLRDEEVQQLKEYCKSYNKEQNVQVSETTDNKTQ